MGTNTSRAHFSTHFATLLKQMALYSFSLTHTYTQSHQISALWLKSHCSTEIHREARTTWAAIIPAPLTLISSMFQTPGPGLGLQLSTLHWAGLDTAGNVPLKLIVSAGLDHTQVHINTQTEWINVKNQIKAINTKHTVLKLKTLQLTSRLFDFWFSTFLFTMVTSCISIMKLSCTLYPSQIFLTCLSVSSRYPSHLLNPRKHRAHTHTRYSTNQ